MGEVPFRNRCGASPGNQTPDVGIMSVSTELILHRRPRFETAAPGRLQTMTH